MGPVADGKVLVTGGGGFLGGAIVRRLAERGGPVRSFSRSAYPELADLGVEQIQGDIADPRAVKKACEGIQLVFHTAALPGVWGDYDRFFRINTLGTRNLIQACRETGVARLIHTSSPSVVFDGSDMEGVDESVPYPSRYHAHYPHTKALAEQAVVEAARTGLPAVILRPHLIWGPGDRHLVPRILERSESLRIVGPGRNVVDTIYIDNAADAHLLAAGALRTDPGLSGRIYFISQDDPIQLWEMVNRILRAGNKPPVTRHISHRAARAAGSSLEFLYRFLNLKGEPRMTRFVADELATSHWFDISAAKRDLGYRPAISTQEGLRRLKNWLSRSRQE